MLALHTMKKQQVHFTLILLGLLIFAACVPAPEDTSMRITLVADGVQRAYAHDQQITVGQFLEQVGLSWAIWIGSSPRKPRKSETI
jgi:hypothetical protein